MNAPAAAAHIRPATPLDVDQIILRWRELMAAHHDLDPALYALAPHAEGTYRAFVRKQIMARDGVVLVSVGADAVVDGYLLGGTGRRAPVFKVREVGMVFDLVVTPSRRGDGMGRALTAACMARFRAAGLSHAQVTWAPENPTASAFWPKQGFEVLLTEAYRAL